VSINLADDPFELLVRSVVDYAIYMLNPDGRVTSWNAGAQRIKGYTAEEITGEHFSRFYTPEDRAKGVPEQALAAARETGRYEAEGWRMRKDGTRLFIVYCQTKSRRTGMGERVWCGVNRLGPGEV